MGIAQFATCSDRTVIAPVNSFKKAQKKLAFQQRWLARKEKFSHHWQKLRLKIARLHAHIADIRNDFLNKLTSKLSNNHAGIVLEDLQVSAMSRSAKGTSDSPGRNVKAKSGLNRSILDQGWYAFREKLAYKLQWLGKPLILVAPKNTSLTCASCGHIAKENRPSRSRFSCQACGHEAHADANAAENILAAGRAASARGEPALARSVKREPLPVGFGLPAGIPSL